MKPKMLVGIVLSGLLIAAGTGQRLFGEAEPAQTPQTGGNRVPTFRADRSWPNVPAKWKLGDVASVAVDAQDHVWILHRPRTLPADQKIMAAPPVLEFDAAGTFIQAWGGAAEGYEWPEREHGIYVDHKGRVWIGGNNDPGNKLPGLKPLFDDQLVVFTKAGKFVMQIGRSSKSGGDVDTKNFHKPADIFVYPKTNEVFVADGYGNHRLIVLDADTGMFKRMWGAFGNKPGGPAPVQNEKDGGPQQFDTVHAVRVSNDGLVYVADRGNKRVQVFTLDGKFVKQAFVKPETKGLTARSLAFSPDPAQEFLYVGGTPEIHVLNRKRLEILTTVGGANPHHMTADSKGNIYSAETTEGSGIQKFVFTGMSSSPSR